MQWLEYFMKANPIPQVQARSRFGRGWAPARRLPAGCPPGQLPWDPHGATRPPQCQGNSWVTPLVAARESCSPTLHVCCERGRESALVPTLAVHPH